MPGTKILIPTAAATVVLLREHDDDVQVLLTRRSDSLEFMGGVWVFPGGKVDAVDRLGPLHAGIEASAETSDSAFQNAGCRELFEETGLLLAAYADGSMPTADQVSRLQGSRAASGLDPAAFYEMLKREGLCLQIGSLINWAHWLTPAVMPRRFDTRFVTARAPFGQAVSVDGSESTMCHWQSVREFSLGQAQLPTAAPTNVALRDVARSLHRHGSLDEMLRAESSRSMATILPKVLQNDTGKLVIYPWDPQYRDLPGEGLELPPAVLAEYAEWPSRRQQ
jgi:8-oxo-dGTP pyrophosphatase MutT (NUDIX family)